jgi:hypothetical protein
LHDDYWYCKAAKTAECTPVSYVFFMACRRQMAHCINRASDTILDISNAKKVIGEAGMDKLVSAVACIRPSARSRPTETASWHLQLSKTVET